MIKKLYLLAFLSLFACSVSMAQTTLDVNFNGLGFLDNREYKDFISRSRTYSGTRTALDFGLNIDTLNSFVVGANAIHEFGAVPYFLKVNPIAYYSFHNKSWLFNAGEFSRNGLIDSRYQAIDSTLVSTGKPFSATGLLLCANSLTSTLTFVARSWLPSKPNVPSASVEYEKPRA